MDIETGLAEEKNNSVVQKSSLKVFIPHVPAGAGHQRAAEAIGIALRALHPQDQVTVVNAADQSDSFYQWAFSRGYLGMIQYMPVLWGALYYLTDFQALAPVWKKVHRLSNWLHGRQFEKFLVRNQPDIVIGTHFFPMEVASAVKLKHRLSMKLITVITDYLPHTLWIAPGIDMYVIGSQQGKEELIKRGVHESQIRLLGIPIDPKFSQEMPRDFVARQLGFRSSSFTVLIGSGGLGVGPIVSLVKILGKMSGSMQIIAVAGKNKELFQELENLRPHIPHSMKVYGFINNMDELMEISDLIITKPGGLTCAEAMVKGLPMIVLAAIPGQETRNSRILEECGIAVPAKLPEEVPDIIRGLLLSPQRLGIMARRARDKSFPNAAFNIARLIVS